MYWRLFLSATIVVVGVWAPCLSQEPSAGKQRVPRMSSDDPTGGGPKVYHDSEESRAGWSTVFPAGFGLSIDLPAEPRPVNIPIPPKTKAGVKMIKSIASATPRLAVFLSRASITKDCDDLAGEAVESFTHSGWT